MKFFYVILAPLGLPLGNIRRHYVNVFVRPGRQKRRKNARQESKSPPMCTRLAVASTRKEVDGARRIKSHSVGTSCSQGVCLSMAIAARARAIELVERYGDTRRLAKCATVPGSIHRAIDPRLCPCLRSLTTRTGCGAPFTYKRALSPRTSIFTMVHSPGMRST